MNKTLLNKIFLLSIITLLYNCKEPFEIEVLDFDSVLVVEGTLSNELKNQKIRDRIRVDPALICYR